MVDPKSEFAIFHHAACMLGRPIAISVAKNSDHEVAIERLRLGSLFVILATLIVAALSAPLVGVHWSSSGASAAALCLSVLLGASLRLRSFDRQNALATFSEVLALILLGGLANAALAMIALRSGAPMADSLLKWMDSLAGLSAQGLVSWMTDQGTSLEPLHIIYESSFPQLAVTVLLLPFLGRQLEAWRLCFLFLAALLTCALISFVLPAYGSFIDAAPSTIRALPAGAGTYAFESVAQFRATPVAELGLNDITGVITFPSFHTIMALITIQAWSWTRTLRLPILGWNLAVIFTTLPMGGHYYVDIAAGIVLWWGWSSVAKAIVRRTEPENRAEPILAA